MTKPKTKTYLRLAITIILWTLAGILGLTILVIVALQFPGVQRTIAQKALSSISETTHTRIEVGSVTIGFPNSIVLHNVFLESRQRDTLLFVQTLTADVNLFRLFSRDITLKRVRVDSLTAHITRSLSDSSFNFDFILNALSPPSAPADSHPVATGQPGWEIHVGTVSVNGLSGTYDDEVSGLNLRVQLGTLKVIMDKFDPDKNQFHADELSLTNAIVSIIQTKSNPPDESPSPDVDLGARSLSVANVQFSYDNSVDGEHYGVDLGTSTLLAETIDLPARHIAVKNFLLENTSFVAIVPNSTGKKAGASEPPALPWVVSLDHLVLNNSSARYDVRGAADTKGLDPNHLRLDGLTMRAEALYYSDNRLSAVIHSTSAREHSGLTVRELSGQFTIDSLHARLADFTVGTPSSRIHQDILLSYSSLSTLKDLPGNVNVKAEIGDSHLGVSDLLLVLPSLPLKNTPGATIRFSSTLSGLVKNLHVEALHVAAGDSTLVDLTGSIRGLPNAETAEYDVDLRLLSSGRKDLEAILADSLLPTSLSMPASISMKGNFRGTAGNFSTSADITTSVGFLKGTLTLDSGKGQDSADNRWKAELTAEEFNVGLLLNDPQTFGPVSLHASATGTGMGSNAIRGQLDAEADKATVNGYAYRGISIHGLASPVMFDGNAGIKDPNIILTFNGSANWSDNNPHFKFTLDLKGADLRQLNLSHDDIQVAGVVVTSDLTGRTIDDIVGTLGARHVVIIKNRKRYLIDSLVVASMHKDKQTHISVESTIFEGQLDGSIAPGELPLLLKSHLAHYFALQGVQPGTGLKPQAFAFRIVLRDPTTLTEVFFPQLHQLTAGRIDGSYDSDKKKLDLNVDIPRIDYTGFRMDSLALKITSDAEKLSATLTVGSIADSTFRVRNLQIAGQAANDSIHLAVQSIHSDGSTTMRLGGILRSVTDGYQWQFNKDEVVFHNLPWSVPADNYLLLGRDRFIAHNIMLQGAGQSLSVKSTDENNPRSPLSIEFTGFDLATISHVVERESGLFGGLLNGSVVLRNLGQQMAFTSDVTIGDFSFSGRRVGDVTLRANNQTENVYKVLMGVAGSGNQIDIQGTYRSVQGGNELDLSCDFKAVNLTTIEPFTFGNVKRLSGTLTGGLHLTGTLKKPVVIGELNFTKAAFNPAFLDTYLRLDNGKIEFDGNGVELKSFDLVDTLGNKASLSGHLYTETYRSFAYDLKVHTNKFLVLNKPSSRDALYYGTIVLNSDISVTGDQQRPVVVMQAELDKGTNLTLILPESELVVEERRGIVRFVNVKTPANSIMTRQTLRTESDTTEAALSSLDLTSNISVNKDSKLRILIDPISGDSLVIQGEATLSFTIDPSGKLTLTGRYDILKGSYLLSFGDFVKKEFAISSGSSLTWFGSPYDADVDITAMYTVRASALDLVQDQLAGTSQEERNKYKQELPIQVYLIMKGKLLKPDIHFRLDLPPDKRGLMSGSVYAKLSELNGQESELNKQVFALLILGRFIPEDPLATAAGSGVLADFARSSVSQILSTQLNRLSEQYLAGANLNVGLESYQDYSTGNAEGRTQLKLALSKELFDERVTVQVGGNVDLEGRRSQENSLNSFAGDLKVFYKLTRDGRWQLQVFRQNSYEGAIDGDIIKTGVGVIFSIDFEKLFGITLAPVPQQSEN